MREIHTVTRSQINVRHTVPDWIARIQNLLTIHTTQLVENEEMWLVFVPEHGQIQANVSKLVPFEEYDPRLQALSDQSESGTQDLGEAVL